MRRISALNPEHFDPAFAAYVQNGFNVFSLQLRVDDAVLVDFQEVRLAHQRADQPTAGVKI